MFFVSYCWEALLLRKKNELYIVITFRKSENICSVSISTVSPHCSYENSFLHPRAWQLVVCGKLLLCTSPENHSIYGSPWAGSPDKLKVHTQQHVQYRWGFDFANRSFSCSYSHRRIQSQFLGRPSDRFN